jgi:hypothetical protein
MTKRAAPPRPHVHTFLGNPLHCVHIFHENVDKVMKIGVDVCTERVVSLAFALVWWAKTQAARAKR